MFSSISDLQITLSHGECQLSGLAEELFSGKMFSARKSVFMFAFVTFSVPCFCAPRGTALRQAAKDMAYPITSDSSLGELNQ